MGGGDEGKPMLPLFPRLHIDDADIGGPRPPPRNKMSLCDQYNVYSQRPSINSSSMAMLPLPSGNGCNDIASQTSSSNVSSTKQKSLSACNIVNESSHSPEKYSSYCSNGVDLNVPATNSEPRGLGRSSNYRNPFVSENLMMTRESNLSQPLGLLVQSANCWLKKDGNENALRLPSFLRPTKPVGNHQLALDKEKLTTSSSFIPSGKLNHLNSYAKLPKESSSKDLPKDFSEKISEDNEVYIERLEVVSLLGGKIPSISKMITEPDTEAVQSLNHHKNFIFMDDRNRLRDPPHKERGVVQESRLSANDVSERFKRKRNPSAVHDLSHLSPSLKDNDDIQAEPIKRRSEDKDCVEMQLGNPDEGKQEISQESVGDSISDLDLNTDDIVGEIRQKLFWKARKTIIHQQKLFATQIFELHRVVKVQKLIARSPEVLDDKNINLNIPSSIKFPPINNLLYEIPLNPSCYPKKPKIDAVRPNDDGIDHKRAEAICEKLVPSVTNKCDKEHHLPRQSSLKSSSTQASILSYPKLNPCCFHPPPGNQWLVPVKSPSEGLIYKPFTGPAPPSISILAPVSYGNCRPINVSSTNRMVFCLSAPDSHGVGHSLGPTLGFQPFAMPILDTKGPNDEIEQIIQWGHPKGSDKNSSTPFDLNLSIPCNIQNPPDHFGHNLHRYRDGSETQGSTAISLTGRSQTKPALSLFPTTPSSHQKNQSNEQKVQVIKVVPHNPRTAPESAARIFRSIQEERRKTKV